MTIEHANEYISNLRIASPSWLATHGGPAWETGLTPRQAKKLAKAADDIVAMAPAGPPNETSPADYVGEYNAWMSEWNRLLVRIYDESQRLRAIGEGR